MRSWNSPLLPSLPGRGAIPSIHDTPNGAVLPLVVDNTASLYVCGITPYDATHIGHANTYLAYDTLNRVLRDAGCRVSYVQNVTDVDDPLLERAAASGSDWRALAESQVELFRGDMQALRIIPPEHYVGVVESIQKIAAAVAKLLDAGMAYLVESTSQTEAAHGADVYFDIAAAEALSPWQLGQVSGLDRAAMLILSAERGGDPERVGKRDPLDPLLWRAARDGEPSWESVIGAGRPGWHIECSVIGLDHLEPPITLNGGGSDLVFPHHELSAAHSASLSGRNWSHSYSHAGMVAYEGEKMSKSLGNLVLVSALVASGVDPRAIRLALLGHHYRASWEWTEATLVEAVSRLDCWESWAKTAVGTGQEVLEQLRAALSDDLDTPTAIRLIDSEIAAGRKPTTVTVDSIDLLLGVSL